MSIFRSRGILVALAVGLGAIGAGTPANAQVLQWNALDNTEFNGERFGTLALSVPQTDDIAILATCRAQPSRQVEVQLFIDAGTNPPGRAINVLFATDVMSVTGRPGVVAFSEYFGPHGVVMLSRNDDLWGRMRADQQLSISLDGRSYFTASLRGSSAAITRFFTICDAVWGITPPVATPPVTPPPATTPPATLPPATTPPATTPPAIPPPATTPPATTPPATPAPATTPPVTTPPATPPPATTPPATTPPPTTPPASGGAGIKPGTVVPPAAPASGAPAGEPGNPVAGVPDGGAVDADALYLGRWFLVEAGARCETCKLEVTDLGPSLGMTAAAGWSANIVWGAGGDTGAATGQGLWTSGALAMQGFSIDVTLQGLTAMDVRMVTTAGQELIFRFVR